MKKYIKIWIIWMKLAFENAMVYRADFVMSSFATLVGTGVEVLFIEILAPGSETISGWSRGGIFIVMGFAKIIESVAWTFYRGGLVEFGRDIRSGNADKKLLLPMDFQFTISFGKFAWDELMGFVAGCTFIVYGVAVDNLEVTFRGIILAGIAVIFGLIFHYVFRLVYSALAVFTTVLEHADFFDHKLFQIGRFPVQVYPRLISHLFTFAIPIAFIGTVPAEALLCTVDIRVIFYGLFVGIPLFVFSRTFLKWCLRFYEGVGR